MYSAPLRFHDLTVPPAAPSAPLNVKVTWLNDTHINVTWHALTLLEAGGFVNNYTVSYGSGKSNEVTVPMNRTSVLVGGLSQDNEVCVEVWASNGAGAGMRSEQKCISPSKSAGGGRKIP